MKFLVIEHERDSGMGLLGDAAVAAGDSFDVVRPTEEPLPTSVDGYDGLVVLGAAPSVNDAEIAGWFVPEIDLIRSADASGRPILGVCFGAQAMAIAFGGSVTRADRAETGWMTVDAVDAVDPESYLAGPWFQWHVDAITPPVTATVMARSSVCVQAYEIGDHIAVQFHPEVGHQQVADWAASDASGLLASGKTVEEMLAETDEFIAGATLRAAALWNRYRQRTVARSRVEEVRSSV
jgi:GMP synthase-like glutamine amidotransferase